MDIKLVEKFLDIKCTPEEAQVVLNWLATEEGEQYQQKRLEEDSQLLQDERLTPFMPGVESPKNVGKIDRETATPSLGQDREPRHRSSFSWWDVAVAMLIVAASSAFYMQNQDLFTEDQNPQELRHYAASADQHKN